MVYLILTEQSDISMEARVRLITTVKSAMEQGWRCQGGINLVVISFGPISVSKYIYSQAMVREGLS